MLDETSLKIAFHELSISPRCYIKSGKESWLLYDNCLGCSGWRRLIRRLSKYCKLLVTNNYSANKQTSIGTHFGHLSTLGDKDITLSHLSPLCGPHNRSPVPSLFNAAFLHSRCSPLLPSFTPTVSLSYYPSLLPLCTPIINFSSLSLFSLYTTIFVCVHRCLSPVQSFSNATFLQGWRALILFLSQSRL